jgi:hypothetical protein
LAFVCGLLSVAVVAVSAGSASGGEPAAAASEAAKAAGKCKRATVNGKRVCLKLGQKCSKAFEDDYVAAGFSCDRGRLRRATIRELRGAQPVLINDQGQISLGTALAAFDKQIADLPGVKAKPGEIGNLTDGTMVIEEIEAHIDELSPGQRAVFDSMTTPSADALVVSAGDPPAARLRTGTPEEKLAAEQYIDAATPVMRSHGFVLLRPIRVEFLDDQGTKDADTLAYVTGADLPPGTSPFCNIFVTRAGRDLKVPEYKQMVLTHELAHCAQHAFYTSLADRDRAPKWVKEGSAEWLAGMTMLELGKPALVAWGPWLVKPKIDLFRRSYDAVGFFAMIQQAGVDGWARVRDTLSAAAAGGSPAAFAAATAGLPEIFYARWGPGLIRDPSLGPEWDYEGPAIPSLKTRAVTIGNGTRPVASTIAARASAAGKLQIKADVVTIQADKDIRGLLRFDGELRKLKKGAYCAKRGGCKCKTRTNLQLPEIGATTYIGFGDPAKPRTVVIQGRSLQDYCKKPRPGPAPCTARPAAGRAGATCPIPPAPGIQVFQGSFGQQVALFREGDCTAGTGFTAISTDGAWRLEIGIQQFTGFGRDYIVPYSGPDPEVVIEGPGGPYSNVYPGPPDLENAGAVGFDGTGRGMALGLIGIFNPGATAGVTTIGGMSCVYPDD